MIQSWENLVMDGQTGRRTDESDFIGRCPTNASVQKVWNMFKYVQWRRSGDFVVKFEHISELFLVFILLDMKK